MFRSSARLSTGAPCHTANARGGHPYPALGTGLGFPSACAACAARLQTRYLARRLSLPLVDARPSGLRIRSALPTGSPMISLEQEQPAVKAGWGGRILLGILAGESDLGEYSPLVARTGTGAATASPVPGDRQWL